MNTPASRPTVIVLDMYVQLSDIDHMDLMVTLGCDAFDIKGIVLDHMRPGGEVEDPASFEGAAYIRQFLDRLGFQHLPVYSGERTKYLDNPPDSEGALFIRDCIRKFPGLLILSWASMSETMIAWRGLEPEAKPNLWRAYGNLGWFDTQVHAGKIQTNWPPREGTPTHLQDDTNVEYDPGAFFYAVTGDLPFWWYPVGRGRWLWHDVQEVTRNLRKEIAVWLSRELFMHHVVREINIYGNTDDLAIYFRTHRDHLMGVTPAAHHPRIVDPYIAICNLDREDLANRPIQMWETGSTHHAACAIRGVPCDSVTEHHYRVQMEWRDGFPYLVEKHPDPAGIPVLIDPVPDKLRQFCLDCMQRFR